MPAEKKRGLSAHAVVL